MVLVIFKIPLHLRDPYFFYVRKSGNFERFPYFNFDTDFLENENLFQKTGAAFFS